MADVNNKTNNLQGVAMRDSLFGLYDIKSTYVRIADHDKEAWLYLVAKPDGTDYTLSELESILTEHEVVNGVNKDNLIAMCKKRVYEREIKVAEYTKGKSGQNGYFEYFVDIFHDRQKPTIREDGSVDYQSMNRVLSVQEKQPIARYHHAKQPIPDRDVKGFDLPAEPAKGLIPLQCRGIERLEEDPDLYIATKEGKIENKDGKISIISEYQINGDVDMIIGNIEFYGDVVISGNVAAGVIIKAGKNITIDGTVEAANLYAGGDIILKRGLQGNNKANVVCKGDVYAAFLEHANIKAVGDITANILLNCNVECDGKINVLGKKGALIGGNVHGTKGIECKELGNDVEVKTIVHAGCPIQVLADYRKELKNSEDFKQQMIEITDELKSIEKTVRENGGLTKSIELRIQELKDKLQQTKECMDQNKAIMQEQKKCMEKGKNATVHIDGKVYSGSIICIDQARVLIEKDTMFMEYRNIAGMIAGSVVASK